MPVIVATSTVADNSMYSRYNVFDIKIIKNREHFLERNGIQLSEATRLKVTYDREDFCHYVKVNEQTKGDGMHDDSAPVCDALVTTDLHHALFLPIADCIGAALYDPICSVLALAHLGRHSLEQNGAQKIVEYLHSNYNSNPADILVWLTPAPNKEAYPIWALENRGMKEVAFAQLAAAGIAAAHITDNPADSTTDLNYFSYSEFLKGNRSKDGDYAIVAMMTG